MMYLYNVYVWVITLLYVSGCSGSKEARSVRVTCRPKRLRSFETSVKLTFRFGKKQQQENSTTAKIIKVKVFNRKRFITAINKTIRSFVNQTQLELSCEVFATAGRYSIEYYVEGLTRNFIALSPRPIIVRNERIQIDVQKNHTAFGGSVSTWLSSKQGRCKPFKGEIKLYWIKNSKEHVMVATRKINKDIIENRTRVHFKCNVFDTAGTFYFVYISDYNNRTVAKSHNVTVSWGKYEIAAQSKNIFPCSNSFVIKFSSPYCDRTEDKIELRSKAHNNIINSQTAYHGFRSVFFQCVVFKRHIREYCFQYVTKSSLSGERKVQATLCVPSKKTELRLSDWTEWSPWGACSSLTQCGQGRKYRLRICPPLHLFSRTAIDKPRCTGEHMDSMPCTLKKCETKIKAKNCKSESCGCVLSTSGGTIVPPRLPLLTQLLPSCHWFIKITKGMRVKLWFDSLKLSENSSVVIRDGNNSTSKILKSITYQNQGRLEDIYSTTNVMSIWYTNNVKFNRNNTGFLISYASVEKLTTPLPSTMIPNSSSRKLAKMTFIGILAILIVVTFTIIAIVIVRVRRRRLNESAAKTPLSQPSSHTSTACMSESTTRSFYEPQLSVDKSLNNNSSLSRVNNNHRPRLSSSYNEHRAPVHVCPRCCPHIKYYRDEYNTGCHDADSRTLHMDSYYGASIEPTVNMASRRVHSIIERRLSGASFTSDENSPHRNYPEYL